ncbi:hypothetical protein RhiirB3_449681 [Rhizophagus irregularis]|nr:hypothetical protein RhiirB3_449681 [Rhizophagus irregularis]
MSQRNSNSSRSRDSQRSQYSQLQDSVRSQHSQSQDSHRSHTQDFRHYRTSPSIRGRPLTRGDESNSNRISRCSRSPSVMRKQQPQQPGIQEFLNALSQQLQSTFPTFPTLLSNIQSSGIPNRSSEDVSSPVLKRRRNRKLSPMSNSFRKTLHDEVVQIYNSLNTNLHFDLSKTFRSQKKTLNKRLLPAIKSTMNPSLKAYDTEIMKVIKQLHKSWREIWRLRQEDGRIEKHNRKQHIASRRDQKLGRRRKELLHMVSTKDKLLTDCHPSSDISWNEFIRDCETAINTPELHLDKCSSNDEDIVQEERDHRLRPENIISTNSVIKIYNKKWRSTRIKEILYRANEIGISTGIGLTRVRYRSNAYIDNKSKSNDKMPRWWISSAWVPSSESDNDDINNDIINDDEHNRDDDYNSDDDDDNNNANAVVAV